MLKSDSVKIMDTFGVSPGAKLELGEGDPMAVLRIPENALDPGYNITFQIDPKGKSTGVLIGKVYHTQTQVAGAQEFPQIVSSGFSFKVELPAGNKRDANLAIGEIATDDAGRTKITWQMIASTKIDDATGKAYFELPWLADAYLHVTTKPPMEPKP